MLSTADRFRWHAEVEFRGVSEIYFEWASCIAQDDEILALIEGLPDHKQRAPLLFAAARFAGAPVGSYARLRPWLVESWDVVEAIARSRSQQTNEAGRCATLLPALAEIHGPLALLEVGAAGGACLFPDRYAYEYTTVHGASTGLGPSGGSHVLLRCEIDPTTAIPKRIPDVVWRAGIDLNPLSFANRDDVAWLETLVWPEPTERRERLEAVAKIIRADPPGIAKGDAIDLLPALAAEAPSDATLVVFNSAVLAYFTLPDRVRFADTVRALDATWLSNEGPGVLLWVTAQVDPSIEIGQQFILARDNRPIALTGGHGQTYHQL